jgi:hypothetical protein
MGLEEVMVLGKRVCLAVLLRLMHVAVEGETSWQNVTDADSEVEEIEAQELCFQLNFQWSLQPGHEFWWQGPHRYIWRGGGPCFVLVSQP